MKDICCIGHITKDKIITPRQTVYMAGGTSFYFSYAINHLPDNVSFQLVTKLGEGEMKAVDDMRNVGIDVLTYPSRHTVYFENKYGDDQNDRTQRVLERADPFTIEEMKSVDARVYHLGTLLNDDISPELVKYLSTKGKISIDAQGYLWCRAQGMDVEESGRFAAAMCTRKLEHSGPFEGTVEDVQAVLATTPCFNEYAE